MISKILRWLSGYVIFTITGKFPERLMNLAIMSGISIINPVGEKGKITATVSINDYKKLYKIRKASQVSLKIIDKKGLPFTIHRNKNRKGLIVGAIIFVGIIYFMSMFVWSVDINGNKMLSIYEIQNGLRNQGIYVGALKSNINVEGVERSFSLDVGKVGWISVNLVGCVADVEISESYDVPEIIESDKPSNLRATKTGQVLKMDIKQGKNVVSVGDGVAKGQILVSGIFDIGETGTSRFVHSDGEVYAGVTSKEEITIQKNIEFMSLENIAERRVLRCMSLKFPLDFFKVDNVYSKSYSAESFMLNNRKIPFEMITEHNYNGKIVKKKYSKKEAESLADLKLTLDDVFVRWGVDIQNRKVKCTENKDSYTFNAEYYCVENIAEVVPINVISD